MLYALCSIHDAALFLFVCLFVWFLLSHYRYALVYAHLLYYLLCSFNPIFLSFMYFLFVN